MWLRMFGTTLLGRLSHRLLWTRHAALPRTKPLLQLSKIAQWSGHLQQGRLSSHLGSGSLLLRASGCASIATPWRTAPSQVVMPEVIGNKRAGPALRDGTVLCPQWNQGLCVNGDACPVAHRCAAVYRSGRVCGGHHPALECRSPKMQWVNVHTTPAPKPPARKRGGTAEGVTPKRVRRGQEPAAGRGPEPEEARPSHREPAAEASSSHRGPAAADEEFVDVLVEDEPEPVPMTPPPRARVLPLAKLCPSRSRPARRRRPVERPTMFGTQSGGSSSPTYLCRKSATFMGRWPCRSQLWARHQKPGME